jgi:hypothetical protein
MTTRCFALVLVLGMSACAARPAARTVPVRYACGDAIVVRTGEQLLVDASAPVAPTALGWRDDDGDHFVAWPHATTDVEAVEYVMPSDPRLDAIEKRYDATPGYARSDWRLLDKRVCRAEGGYTDALARWMNGDSLDEVARDLELGGRKDARKFVRKALVSLQKQYLSDR